MTTHEKAVAITERGGMVSYTAQAKVRPLGAHDVALEHMTIRFMSDTPPDAAAAMQRYNDAGYETSGTIQVRETRRR